MPELLRSAKLAVEKGLAQGRNESYIKQLSDYIIPALVEALHKVWLCVVTKSFIMFCFLNLCEDVVLIIQVMICINCIACRNRIQKSAQVCWMP